MATQTNSEPTYPAIRATLGWKWLSIWSGRMTDAELDRQEAFSAKLIRDRAHEAECESAAMALLSEAGRKATS